MLISSMTARGLTLTTSFMKVPLSSENGPNDIAWEQPSTSVKKVVAAFTSGTVMPVWSWPRRPGMESADARFGNKPTARVASAVSNSLDVFMILSFALRSTCFFVLSSSLALARRCQLAFNRLRIVGKTLGDAARHFADIDILLAGFVSIEDLGCG